MGRRRAFAVPLLVLGAKNAAGAEKTVCELSQNNQQDAFLEQACHDARRGHTDRTHPRPWRPDACSNVPSWIRDELQQLGRGDELYESGTSCDPLELPLSPPNMSAAGAIPVRRVNRDVLGWRDFLERHASTGLPLVIAGAVEPHVLSLRAPSLVEVAFASRPGVDPQCDPAIEPSGQCSSDTHGSARVCYTPECLNAATLDARTLGSGFRWPPPLPEALLDRTAPIFSAFSGERFGSPTHVDGVCQGQLAVQWVGSKHWELWSPGWPTPLPGRGGARGDAGGDGEGGGGDGGAGGDVTHQVHARFEASVHPGDAIFFAPGWSHATRVLDDSRLSVSATYQFNSPPMYGSILNVSGLRRSPFGYGACATEPHGWDAADAAWRRILAEHVRDEDGDEQATAASAAVSQQRVEL